MGELLNLQIDSRISEYIYVIRDIYYAVILFIKKLWSFRNDFIHQEVMDISIYVCNSIIDELFKCLLLTL